MLTSAKIPAGFRRAAYPCDTNETVGEIVSATVTQAETLSATEAARLNIPGRLERLPMTGYQKRLFAIVRPLGSPTRSMWHSLFFSSATSKTTFN
jgi:hypothetical protein